MCLCWLYDLKEPLYSNTIFKTILNAKCLVRKQNLLIVLHSKTAVENRFMVQSLYHKISHILFTITMKQTQRRDIFSNERSSWGTKMGDLFRVLVIWKALITKNTWPWARKQCGLIREILRVFNLLKDYTCRSESLLISPLSYEVPGYKECLPLRKEANKMQIRFDIDMRCHVFAALKTVQFPGFACVWQ